MSLSAAPEIETLMVQGSEMEVFLFQPAADTGPHPGIILAQHIPVGHTGVENDEFTLRTAARFAENGFVVAIPFLFHWWDKSAAMDVKRASSRDDLMVADVQACFSLLSGKANVTDKVGIVGHCWGGRVAWLGACHLSDMAACAVFYGGRIKLAMGEGNAPPVSLASRINCPVIGFFGNDDQNPSPTDVDDYDQALTAAGVAHSFHRYDDAGHAFQNFPTPERYRHEQSEDAWVKVLRFMHQHLA